MQLLLCPAPGKHREEDVRDKPVHGPVRRKRGTHGQVSGGRQSEPGLGLTYLCQEPKATQIRSSPCELAGGSSRCRPA